ncbi:MAG: N-formylglutamate amidohydrolase [Alphaproteobacteria bacterium]|nr:N-formylglutamate amidohydrolase [Alphaproteobacteria bacterium]
MTVDRGPFWWSSSSVDEAQDRQEAASGQPAIRHDPVLAQLYATPYSLSEPVLRSVPFIFASPHSGRLYPQSLLRGSRLPEHMLRRSEDAYVDYLFAEIVSAGAPLIAARFPRAYVDANRAPGELDASMFTGPLNMAVEQASPRVNAGLGVIPRLVRDGMEIYRSKLAPSEAGERLSRLHARYHAALAALVRESCDRFGAAAVIDCHSMPSAVSAPDIVLGDRYGTAASHSLLRRAELALLKRGFTVGRNVPYAGGYTTQLYGQPARGVHALQIEVNRALYLHEDRVELTPGFRQVQDRLFAAMAELLAIDVAVLWPAAGMRIAAE